MNADEPDVIAAYVDAAAPLARLAIEPAWRPGVIAHFAAIQAAAELVAAFPLDDEVEAAPIFTP